MIYEKIFALNLISVTVTSGEVKSKDSYGECIANYNIGTFSYKYLIDVN